MKKSFLAGCILLAGLVTFAQNKTEIKNGDQKWKARLRMIAVMPPSTSYDLSGSDVKISTAFVPELDFTYFFTQNFAAELILATAKHNVKTVTNGTEAKLGSVWLLPPTLNLQYHIPLSGFTPYFGAGVNYTIFYGVKDDAVSLGYKNAVGFSTQLGADIDINKKWFINIDVKRLFLKTDVTVNTATKLSDVKINPFIVGLGVGVKL